MLVKFIMLSKLKWNIKIIISNQLPGINIICLPTFLTKMKLFLFCLPNFFTKMKLFPLQCLNTRENCRPNYRQGWEIFKRNGYRPQIQCKIIVLIRPRPDKSSKGAHTLRAVLREAGRLAGRQAGFGKHGNALESTHCEQELEQAGFLLSVCGLQCIIYHVYQTLPANFLKNCSRCVGTLKQD